MNLLNVGGVWGGERREDRTDSPGSARSRMTYYIGDGNHRITRRGGAGETAVTIVGFERACARARAHRRRSIKTRSRGIIAADIYRRRANPDISRSQLHSSPVAASDNADWVNTVKCMETSEYSRKLSTSGSPRTDLSRNLRGTGLDLRPE